MKKKGFTLIELLVVIAIIGLLSTLAVVSLSGARTKAKDAKIVSDVKALQTAMEMKKNENGGLPSIAGIDAYIQGGLPTSTLGYWICTSTQGYFIAGKLNGTDKGPLTSTGILYDAASCARIVTNSTTRAEAASASITNCNTAGIYCVGDSQ